MDKKPLHKKNMNTTTSIISINLELYVYSKVKAKSTP